MRVTRFKDLCHDGLRLGVWPCTVCVSFSYFQYIKFYWERIAPWTVVIKWESNHPETIKKIHTLARCRFAPCRHMWWSEFCYWVTLLISSSSGEPRSTSSGLVSCLIEEDAAAMEQETWVLNIVFDGDIFVLLSVLLIFLYCLLSNVVPLFIIIIISARQERVQRLSIQPIQLFRSAAFNARTNKTHKR